MQKVKKLSLHKSFFKYLIYNRKIYITMSHTKDNRVVLTLDAGGTNFVFVAMQGAKILGEKVVLPSEARDLDKSIATIKKGFHSLIENIPTAPSAISFVFPAPADYPKGIIYNVGNLPAYAGGVALKDILEEEFKIPVFINNDGDLFVYGEAISGLLPHINNSLALAGNPKRYKNLYGVTLGTGFGGGLCVNGKPYFGDNSNGNEVWLFRNHLEKNCFAEEGACIRAVQKAYVKYSNALDYKALSPKDIEDIAFGKREGDVQAAIKAYQDMGLVIGEALAHIATIFDCPIVIGGGLSYGHKLFMPTVISHMNGIIQNYDGKDFSRLAQVAYNLEDEEDLKDFLTPAEKEIFVYGSTKTVRYDPIKRIGIGISKLGTSEAVAIGAYAFALDNLDDK